MGNPAEEVQVFQPEVYSDTHALEHCKEKKIPSEVEEAPHYKLLVGTVDTCFKLIIKHKYY